MEEKMLAKIKADTLNIISTKAEGVKMATSIGEMIENGLTDIMGCPSCYGLEDSDCLACSCKKCWQYAISDIDK